MTAKLLISFVLMLCALHTADAKEKVFLMLVDGLRWDRLGFEMSSLDLLQENGVAADWTDPVFVTLSSPSMMSIATGLYVESHGVVHNQAFYPDTNYTSMGYLETLNDTFWFNGGGEPIWNTAMNQGLTAGTFMYPGGQVPIDGQQPTVWQLASSEAREVYSNLTERIDVIFDWLYGDYDLDIVLFQLEVIDNTLHVYGFEARETKRVIAEVDALIRYIVTEKMASDEVKDTLNLILTSDHGMVSTPPPKRLQLYDYISETKVNFSLANVGPLFQIEPVAGALEEIYDGLNKAHPAMYVYKKEDFPERFHYGNNPRNLPIIGYVDPTWTPATGRFVKTADHGYDNEEMTMKTSFYAQGPSFRKGYRAKHFESVNIYPLMCELLGIVPAPNNGSRDNYKDMLLSEHPTSPPVTCDSSDLSATSSLIAATFGIVFLLRNSIVR